MLLLVAADLPTNLRARGNVRTGAAPERAEDFRELLGWVAGGDLETVVSLTSDLDGIVDLHAQVDSGHKVGNVIVRP